VVLGFDFWRGLRIFLFTTASRTALGPTQPPIQWVPGALSLGVKRLGREADHSHPSSTEVKEWVELYLHSPNTPSWSGAQLKHTDNFTSYLTKNNEMETITRAQGQNYLCTQGIKHKVTGWTTAVQYPAGAMMNFFHDRVQSGSGSHPASYQKRTGNGGLILGVERPGREVITHLHLVPKLGISGAIPPIPLLH
jgi:hypothetical protein